VKHQAQAAHTRPSHGSRADDDLRHAEQHSSGYQRHLIGYAAANFDTATWIGQDSEEGRLRLATALDYLARATDSSTQDSPGS
jgi:hypothetical protein